MRRARSGSPRASSAARTEVERVARDADRAAALRLRELDRLDHPGDALRDHLVDPARVRLLDGAVRRDHEVRRDGAADARLRQQLLLVAVRDLRQVALEVAADDRL